MKIIIRYVKSCLLIQHCVKRECWWNSMVIAPCNVASDLNYNFNICVLLNNNNNVMCSWLAMTRRFSMAHVEECKSMCAELSNCGKCSSKSSPIHSLFHEETFLMQSDTFDGARCGIFATPLIICWCQLPKMSVHFYVVFAFSFDLFLISKQQQNQVISRKKSEEDWRKHISGCHFDRSFCTNFNKGERERERVKMK